MNLHAQSNKDLKVVAFFLATISIVALLATGNACAPPVDDGAVCGNGIVEAGEKCDPPDGTTCDESCQVITPDLPVCGNGIVEEGEQCEPPNGITCDESCQTITPGPPDLPVCGNGTVEEGEQCDPPDGTTCDESCQTIATDEIGIYLNSLPSWGTFAPQSPSTEPAPVSEDAPESFEEVVEDETYDCTTTRYAVTDNPEKIVMYSPDVEILWPGALIQGKSHRDGAGPGSLLGLVIAERTPIRVSIPSLATGDNYRDVANPNQANVSQAIGSMIGAATADGLATPSSITFKQEVCHSEEEFALGMKVSGRYLGFSASASADFSRNASETTVAAHFYEKMYEVVVEPPQTPGAFFGPDFTQEKLDEQIALGRLGPDNLPVYVSNVTYGRMMMFTLTSTFSEEEIRAAISAAYSGIFDVSAELTEDQRDILQKSRIQVTSLGGDADASLGMIQSGNWAEYFTDSAPLSTARPLSYTFRNLGDGSIASVTETTEYEVKECSALTEVTYFDNELDWRQWVTDLGGEVVAFDTTAANISKADEVDEPPTGNEALGAILNFRSSATGFAFDFWLENTSTTHELGLVFNDQEFTSYTEEDYLSIGDVDNYENDDFEIGVVAGEGSEIFAIGIFVDDSETGSGESLHVYNEQEVELIEFENTDEVQLPDGDMTRDGIFMGVVSPEPLSRIWFDEGSGSDDIRVKDFRFGVR